MTDFETLAEAIKRDRENGTPGPWEWHCGQSDWGMPYSHGISRAGENPKSFDDFIAEVHSMTPYPVGASRREREQSAVAAVNATRIARLPTLETAYLELWARAQELEGALQRIIQADQRPRFIPKQDGTVTNNSFDGRLAEIARAALIKTPEGE